MRRIRRSNLVTVGSPEVSSPSKGTRTGPGSRVPCSRRSGCEVLPPFLPRRRNDHRLVLSRVSLLSLPMYKAPAQVFARLVGTGATFSFVQGATSTSAGSSPFWTTPRLSTPSEVVAWVRMERGRRCGGSLATGRCRASRSTPLVTFARPEASKEPHDSIVSVCQWRRAKPVPVPRAQRSAGRAAAHYQTYGRDSRRTGLLLGTANGAPLAMTIPGFSQRRVQRT